MARERTRRQRRPAPGDTIQQLPFQQYRNPYPPMEIVSADQIEILHEASLKILREIGVNFLLDEARDLLKTAGADVDVNSARVRFDRAIIESAIQTAPAVFKMHARNPQHSLIFGDNYINFSAVSSPPNASDIDNGRRTGNYKDFCDFLRLGQSLNISQIVSGHPVEPIDIEPSVRHLDASLAMIELTDKLFRGYALGRQRILDTIEMARIARGISEAQLLKEPTISTIVNANSPLQFDVPMLWGIIEMARRFQTVIITPFTLAGAMAPVSLAGALAQQNAEALAGIAFTQLVQPGAPVIYGGFTSNVDMKSGSPAFGTPEYAKTTLISAQLARRYKVPFRASNVNASNAPDAQATYESMMSIWSCILGHVNFIHHGLGWLEGGLCASFEKFILDAEMLQGMVEFLKPVKINEAELAFDAIKDVGPGGHFFGTAHTLERYEHAFYQPILSDWRNFETWEEAGSVDATTRANKIYKTLLEQYETPPLDAAIKEELHEFVDRRKAEGGAPTY